MQPRAEPLFLAGGTVARPAMTYRLARRLTAAATLLVMASACSKPDVLPFWEISDPRRGDSVVHVLATVALPQAEQLRFDPAVMAAFEASERLVLPNSAALSKQNALVGWKAHLAEGDNLDQWLTAELFAAYG